MKSPLKYYIFWLKSSRGTDVLTVKTYKEKPKTLDTDLVNWCELHTAWHVSENVCSFGWKELKKVPKNRKILLKQYDKACRVTAKAEENEKILGALLRVI